MPYVSSRDNPRLKEATRLLGSARERRKSGRFVLEGVHLVTAFLARGGLPDWVIADAGAIDDAEVARIIASVSPERVLIAASQVFAAVASLATPSPVIAVAPTPRHRPPADARFVLLLEEIQDPGNVGTILRSAAAAGVDAVHLSPGCAFAWSPKVMRAAQGAHFHLAIAEDANLVRAAERFAGRVYGAVVGDAAPPVFDVDLRGPAAFAIGSEGAGLSAALRDACGALVTIPMPGGFESLNAAVAASVCLFEKVRQQCADIPARAAPAQAHSARQR